VTCGEGVQTRHVNCTENGTFVEDSICLENTPIAKPLEERACQGPCCNGVWAVSNWFDVSILASEALVKISCTVSCTRMSKSWYTASKHILHTKWKHF